MNFMAYIAWYRRARGGRWALITHPWFGYQWIKVSGECLECCDELHECFESARARDLRTGQGARWGLKAFFTGRGP
jgi:hypothetical protein